MNRVVTGAVRRAAMLLVLLLLGACAGKPVERHEYLLPMPVLSVPGGPGDPVRLLPVMIAPYLDQQGIVLQTAGSEVRVARHNEWAEPLDAALDRYLQVAIANAAGRMVQIAPLVTRMAMTEVQVRIQQLHGSSDGDVRLVAEWSVATPDGSRTLHVFDAAEAQPVDGYPGLVAAHAALLDRLASAIAGSLDTP